MRLEVVPWWEPAQANLNAAKVNLAASIYFAVSWFAQQAAEVGAQSALHRAARSAGAEDA